MNKDLGVAMDAVASTGSAAPLGWPGEEFLGGGRSGLVGGDHVDLAAEITSGAFRIDARAVPLADVETAWKDPDSTQRIVFTP